MKWQSGYHGEDSLRDKAHKYMKEELRGAEGGKIPASMSAPQNTKMRTFKKGGHCAGGKMAEGGMKDMSHGQYKAAGGMFEGEPKLLGRIANRARANSRQGTPFQTSAMRRGGHAKADDYRERGKHHGLNHDQTDMHIPTRSRNNATRNVSHEKSERLARGGNMRLNVESNREFERAGMKRGGYEREQAAYERKHGKNKKGFGGLLGGLGGTFFGGPMGGMLGSTIGNMLPFKKGGHAHGRRRAEGGSAPKKAWGGYNGRDVGNSFLPISRAEGGAIPKKGFGGSVNPWGRFAPAYDTPSGVFDKNMVDIMGRRPGFASPSGAQLARFGERRNMEPLGRNPATWGPMTQERMNAWKSPSGMAEGGEAHKRHGGHMKKRASGGSVYEREMVGERPGSKAHHFNYESEMKGERAISKPSSRHQSKRGLRDEEHGQLFREGGAAAKRGGHKKLAAGGVGKIRHNEATSNGSPRGAKRVIRNNLF